MDEKKISNSSWKKQLWESLNRVARKTEPRVAFLGIGNEFNGDDAAGVWLSRQLFSVTKKSDRLLVLDCGQVPENSVGSLRRFHPDLIVLLDAADFGGEPGEVHWIDPLSTSGFSASSHTLPFSVLSKFLVKELGCEVGLIGIQPVSLEFDAGLSSAVKNFLVQLIKDLVELIDQEFATKMTDPRR
jgi:hydrogenase 3 maturation protease